MSAKRHLLLFLILLTMLQSFAPRELVLCFVRSGAGSLEHGRNGRCLGAALSTVGTCTAQTAAVPQPALADNSAGCVDVVLSTLDVWRPEPVLQAPHVSVTHVLAVAIPELNALRLPPVLAGMMSCTSRLSGGYTAMLLTTALRM